MRDMCILVQLLTERLVNLGSFFKPLSGATLDFILLLKFVCIVKSAHLHTYCVVFN